MPTDTDERTVRSPGNKGLSDRQKIDQYLQKAKIEAGLDTGLIGVPSTRKRGEETGTSFTGVGRKARARQPVSPKGRALFDRLFAASDRANRQEFAKAFPKDAKEVLTNPKPAPEPKTVKLPPEHLPFEGVHTSILPKVNIEGDTAPPPPDKRPYETDREYQKRKWEENNPKPPNFQKLQDRVRERQLLELGQVARLGHHISGVGRSIDRSTAGWPYLPGGFALPMLLLFVLLFLLIPVNGQTRIQWLWSVIGGTAAVNPNYVPPVTPPSGSVSGGSGATGAGPEYPTLQSASNITNTYDTYSYYTPSYFTTEYDEY